MHPAEIPRILLVMDNDADNSHAVHILTKYHFANSILRLKEGREAARFFTQVNSLADSSRIDAPELIILSLEDDRQMAEIARASRRDRLAGVPLILVAGNKEYEDFLRKMDLPMTYCIGKPIGFFKLLEAMQKLGMFWLVLKSPPQSPKA